VERAVGDAVTEIRSIFQKWLDGELSQEDALFAIGDVLQRESERASRDERAARPPVRSPSSDRN
jgi:hypothetical protein